MKLFFISLWKHKFDLALALLLAAVSGLSAYRGAQRMPQDIVTYASRDVWFQGASDSLYEQLNDREHDKHARNNIHPFFSLVAHPLVFAIRTCAEVDLMTALRIMGAGTAFLWAGFLYIAVRLIGCRLIDACLYTLLGMMSSCSIFWFVVPETFPLGSLSILVAFCFLLLAERRICAVGWYLMMNLVTFAFATTNWMAGILITLVKFRMKQALQILSNVICCATLLWGVQKYMYPASRFFLDVSGETQFVNVPQKGGVFNVLTSFFYHTLITPAITLFPNPNNSPEWPFIMSLQSSPAGSGSLFGACAVILWSLLLAGGFYAMAALKTHVRLRLVLVFFLLWQLALHAFYGEETFLYSLHFIVPLILMVALLSLTKLRVAALILAFLLLPLLDMNNAVQFRKAVATFGRLRVGIDAGPQGGQLP